jgi:hypothetical protein
MKWKYDFKKEVANIEISFVEFIAFSSISKHFWKCIELIESEEDLNEIFIEEFYKNIPSIRNKYPTLILDTYRSVCNDVDKMVSGLVEKRQ